MILIKLSGRQYIRVLKNCAIVLRLATARYPLLSQVSRHGSDFLLLCLLALRLVLKTRAIVCHPGYLAGVKTLPKKIQAGQYR